MILTSCHNPFRIRCPLSLALAAVMPLVGLRARNVSGLEWVSNHIITAMQYHHGRAAKLLLSTMSIKGTPNYMLSPPPSSPTIPDAIQFRVINTRRSVCIKRCIHNHSAMRLLSTPCLINTIWPVLLLTSTHVYIIQRAFV